MGCPKRRPGLGTLAADAGALRAQLAKDRGSSVPSASGLTAAKRTFRLFKQVLGWTRPKLRDPQAADRWTWLVVTADTQLRLARPLAEDLRLPWERPARRGG